MLEESVSRGASRRGMRSGRPFSIAETKKMLKKYFFAMIEELSSRGASRRTKKPLFLVARRLDTDHFFSLF